MDLVPAATTEFVQNLLLILREIIYILSILLNS